MVRGGALVLLAPALGEPWRLPGVAGIRGSDPLMAFAGVAVLALVVTGAVGLGRLIRGLRRAEAGLRRSRAALMEAQRIAQVGSFETDLRTGVQTGSPQMYRLFGLDPAPQVDLSTLRALIHPDDGPRVDALLSRAVEDLGEYEIVIRVVRPDGETRHLLCRGEVVRDAAGSAVRLVGTNQDVTDAHRSQEQAARLASIVEHSRDAIFSVTVEGTITAWNQSAERVFGFSASEILGRNASMLVPPEAHDEWRQWQPGLLVGRPVEDHETVRVCRDGHRRPVALTISPIRDANGTVAGASVIARDITERQHLQEQLVRQALHDPLTGLANRTLLQDRLAHALANAARTEGSLALLFVDLDDFKLINDTLGHTAGDQLLAAVAERLTASLRATDTVARMGGDEFAVILEGATVLDATRAAESIVTALRPPTTLGGVEVRVRASIGIVEQTGAGDAEALLRDADLAMYEAKRTNKGGYQCFAATMRSTVSDRVDLDAALRRAAKTHQFTVDYQPIVTLADGQISGFEALLRWTHPERGPIGPDVFVPLLEQSGLIVPVGDWVLRTACTAAFGWQSRTGRALSISVNVSPRQLQSADYVDRVADALAGAGLPPSSLILEITEGVMVDDPQKATHVLQAVKRLGVRVALDDFGTGYSSLHYLQTLPVDLLKIDRSFVTRMHDSPDQATLTDAIVKVGHAMRLGVIAEGIETEDQANRLHSIGCQFGQGFHFSRPRPAKGVNELLARTGPIGGSRSTFVPETWFPTT